MVPKKGESRVSVVELVQVASTWFLVGLIWLVQGVQYPLLARLDPSQAQALHAFHSREITWIVGPVMGLELTSSLWLALRPTGAWTATEARVGAALVLLLWASTAFWQVPQHAALGRSWDPTLAQSLVRGNWVRTLLWSLRGLLVLTVLKRG